MKPMMQCTLGAVMLVVNSPQIHAENFYTDRQMQIIISTAPGTVFDQYARLIAQYLEQHIPGNPRILPIYMPGAGGIRAINHIANAVPKDGSVIVMTNQGVPMYQALELGDALRVDVRQLNWIGNMSSSNQVLATWHTSKTKSLEDARLKKTIVGITGAGSINSQLPFLFNNMLSTKLIIVGGYKAGTDINLAMERGELDGRGSNTWASYEALNSDWINNGLIIPIIQVGIRKESTLGHVPLLIDQAKNEEERSIYNLISQVAMISRPIATSPNIPLERIEILRKAFKNAMNDESFIKDTAQQRMEISVLDGEDLQKMVSEIINVPVSVREKAKAAMGL